MRTDTKNTTHAMPEIGGGAPESQKHTNPTTPTNARSRSCCRSSPVARRHRTNSEAIDASVVRSTPTPPTNPRTDAKLTPKGFEAWLEFPTSSGPGVSMNPATQMQAEAAQARKTHRQRVDGMRPVGNRRKSRGRV